MTRKKHAALIRAAQRLASEVLHELESRCEVCNRLVTSGVCSGCQRLERFCKCDPTKR
jgi:hypothetical protein